MKLLILLIILVLIFVVKSSSSKYIYSKIYQSSDTSCSGPIVSSEYDLDGLCQFGAISKCSEDNKSVFIQYFNETNCTGDLIDHETIQVDSCIDGYPSTLSCLDNINLPNENIFLISISETCDWKESFYEIKLNTMNTCFNDNNQIYQYSCNSSYLTKSTYQTLSCSGTPIDIQTTKIINYCSDITGNNVTSICLN